MLWSKGKEKGRKIRRSDFLLVFVFFGLLLFSCFASQGTPDLKEKTAPEHSSNDLFISYNKNGGPGFEKITFFGSNSLLAGSTSYFTETSVMGAKGLEGERSSIMSYKVQKGDTVDSVAEEYGISK